MKTIKLALAAAGLVAVTAVTAIERPKMNVIPLKADRAMVLATNENPAIFEVSIKAENGDVIYYKQTSEPVTDFRQIYDFKNMAEGKYVLNLNVNGTRVINDFKVAGNKIEPGESKTRFAPYFDFKNNALKLSYLNFDEDNLSLSFYNNAGLVYQTNLGKEFNITAGYDLSNLANGNYQVILSSGNDEYTFNLVK